MNLKTMNQGLSNQQLQTLCRLAIQAAQEAGEWIERFDRRKLRAVFKDAGSSEASQLVTEVDIASEAIIRKRLQECSESLDIAFVGEESALETFSAQERFEKSYFWCVDPLDGTLPFSEGRSGYSVSVALVERSGKPVLGVVYDPERQALFHAIDGHGCYRNRAPFNCVDQSSSVIGPQVLDVYADTSFKSHFKYRLALTALERCAETLNLDGVNFIYGNGAVANACQVVNSRDACYLKLPTLEDGGGSIWDYAATACIAREACACVSDIYGEALDLNRPDSTFMNHQGVFYSSNSQIAEFLIGRFNLGAKL